MWFILCYHTISRICAIIRPMIIDNYANVPLGIRNHEHVKVLTPASNPVWVDKNLSVLLVRLWQAGMETLYSCEGSELDAAYIYFVSFEDLKMFDSAVKSTGVEYGCDEGSPIVRFDIKDIDKLEAVFS